MNDITLKRKRGRPPKAVSEQLDVRRTIVRAGVEMLTETSFSASSIDGVLKRVGIPKGSFYYYFDSKEAFGLVVLDHYDTFFEKLLLRTMGNGELAPLDRVRAFVDAAAEGMKKYAYRRGCAVGNLTQEVSLLPDSFRLKLKIIFDKWQAILARCLGDAVRHGQLSEGADVAALATFFWTGWEGAVIRAKLSESREPLDLFVHHFIAGLPQPRS